MYGRADPGRDGTGRWDGSGRGAEQGKKRQGQSPRNRLWVSEMNVNGCESPWIGQNEIPSISLRRIAWRQVAQTTRTGASSVPDGAGVSSPAPSWPNAVPAALVRGIRGESERVTVGPGAPSAPLDEPKRVRSGSVLAPSEEARAVM
jgi:hypothetical protein